MKRLHLIVLVLAAALSSHALNASNAILQKITPKIASITNNTNKTYQLNTKWGNYQLTPNKTTSINQKLALFEVVPSVAGMLPENAVQFKDTTDKTVATLEMSYDDYTGATIKLTAPGQWRLGRKTVFVENRQGKQADPKGTIYNLYITLRDPLSASELKIERKPK